MAGLHDRWPMRSALLVSSRVGWPRRALAMAASHPACPAPTTMQSKMAGNGALRGVRDADMGGTVGFWAVTVKAAR